MPDAPSPTEAQTAMQAALAELLLEIDPEVCHRIARGCLHLAAAAIVMRDSLREHPRVAAAELLALLAEGAPSVESMAAVAS